MKNGDRSNVGEWRWVVAFILVLVAVTGFLPAGPAPHENLAVGIGIWFAGVLIPLAIAFLLVRKDFVPMVKEFWENRNS